MNFGLISSKWDALQQIGATHNRAAQRKAGWLASGQRIHLH